MPPLSISHRRSGTSTPVPPAKKLKSVPAVTSPRTGAALMSKSAAPKAAAQATGTTTSKAAPKRDIKEVWVEYKKNKTEALRNILMENYLHLVRYNAERIHVKLPDEVELDDLMSAGIFGLMDAIAAFDLERGVKFETYCAPRIRGAILDELRSKIGRAHV